MDKQKFMDYLDRCIDRYKKYEKENSTNAYVNGMAHGGVVVLTEIKNIVEEGNFDKGCK